MTELFPGFYQSPNEKIDFGISEPPTESLLAEIEKEGKVRYAGKCPPGYCDHSKEGDIYIYQGKAYQTQFGDLILWKQTVAEAVAKQMLSRLQP